MPLEITDQGNLALDNNKTPKRHYQLILLLILNRTQYSYKPNADLITQLSSPIKECLHLAQMDMANLVIILLQIHFLQLI